MTGVRFPDGYHIERLRRDHPRQEFRSREPAVDQWLATKALQNQEKRLSATTVLVGPAGEIAGYYTLATGEVDFSDLPAEIAKKLPKRRIPVARLAWLGVDASHQGLGLGRRLFAQALRDCFVAGETFPFVAVVVDCLNDAARSFYQQWDFAEIPGHPYRLFLSSATLLAMMKKPGN